MENNINEENKEKSYIKAVFFNSSMDSNKRPIDSIVSRSSSNDAKIQKFHNNKKKFKSNSRRSPNKRFKNQKDYNQNLQNKPKKYRYFKSKPKNKNEKILFESELDINRKLESIEIPFLYKISIDQISNDKFKIYYNNFEIKSKNPKVNSFKNIQLNSQIEDNLSTKLEYNMMTPLQKSAVPLILSKKNVLICDDHNTGKTFSYLVSLISIIQNDKMYLENRNKEICCPVCIVLFPNQKMIELAYLESQFIAYKSNVFISKINNSDNKGKMSKDGDDDDDEKEDNSNDYLNCDILLGTPENLLNLFEKKLIKETRLQFFIIDQFDDIVASSQIDKVDSILKNIPQDCKNYMKFIVINTNLTQEVIKYTEALTFLIFYLVSSKSTDNLVYTKRNIKHEIFEVEEEDKVAKLHEIFQEIEGNAIIFMDRKRRVDELEVFLEERNYNVVAIHGAKVPKKKNIAIKLFSSGEVPILISTDILDSDVELPNVSYIFNFDMPTNIEDYVLRIEKIGRWNKEGTSFSFVNKSNMNIIPDLAFLLKKMGNEIPEFLFNYIKNQKKVNMLKGIEEHKPIGGKKNKNRNKETGVKEKGEDDNDEKENAEEGFYENNNYRKYNNNYYYTSYNNYNYGYNYKNYNNYNSYNNYSYNNYYYNNGGRVNRFNSGYGYNNNYHRGGKYKNNYYGNNKNGERDEKYEVIEKEITEKVDLFNK